MRYTLVSYALFFLTALTQCQILPTPQNQSLYICTAHSNDQMMQLENLAKQTNIDVWGHRHRMNVPIQIRVTNDTQHQSLLKIFNPSECILRTNDIHSWMTRSSLNAYQRLESSDFFSTYQSYAAIGSKLLQWSQMYPDKVQFNSSIGKSMQDRDLYLIKITNFNVTTPKRAIWWNAGQHAREWIGPATVLYLAQKLLNNTDQKVLKYLKEAEFYITPLQNPDGYEFSRYVDRFWRKNRRLNPDDTFGVDLNRNWDEHWGLYGTSTSTESEIYEGLAPFSEPSTKLLAEWVLSIPNRYAGIDFHSFGQNILRNWGWTDVTSQNEPWLKELGEGMRDAIFNQSSHVYESEMGAKQGRSSGCADDWMSSKAKMIGYTIELRDTGDYGFLLPPDQIIPVGEEIWAAMEYFIEYVLSHDILPNA